MDKTNKAPSLNAETQELINLHRAQLIGKIFNYMISLADIIPEEFNERIMDQAVASVERFNREVIRTTNKTNSYFDKTPKDDKLQDIATVVDIIARIGNEEDQSHYDDMLDIIVSTIDLVLYAKENRRTLHIGKVRALFRFVEKALIEDIKRKPSNVEYLKHKHKIAILLDPDEPLQSISVK